jgi:hypothetical protein
MIIVIIGAGLRRVGAGQANNLADLQTDIIQKFIQHVFSWGGGGEETNFLLTFTLYQLCVGVACENLG